MTSLKSWYSLQLNKMILMHAFVIAVLDAILCYDGRCYSETQLCQIMFLTIMIGDGSIVAEKCSTVINMSG